MYNWLHSWISHLPSLSAFYIGKKRLVRKGKMWKYAMEKSEDEAKIMYHWENKAHENKPVGVSIENSAEQSVMEKNMLLMLSNQNASKSGVKEALWIMQ